ncbi:MAG: hypothetical protein GXP25_25065 [Planctomycetes bacterium]|nr:hypothetical protein [Planctomycetota bacterium]
MKSPVDWSRAKAIVLESDDWGGVTRTASPNVEACERAEEFWAPMEGKYDTWRRGTVETVEHMQRCFDLFQAFTGGDGRHVVFSPMVLVGNPDFQAIEANGFTEYADIGIDEGWPEPWQADGAVEKAREGMALGIWRPEYHGRTHHYHGQQWVDVLREHPDDPLRGFFSLRIFGVSNTKVGLEYDHMTEDEMYEWAKVGFDRFERCFGVMPNCAINSDGTDVTERVWVRLGIKARLNAQSKKRTMGEVNPETGMIYLARNVRLEPRGQRDEDTPCGFTGAYRETQEAWEAGEPAVVSVHRKNFTSLDETEDKESWAQIERYFAAVQKEHPDAVYLTSWEVAQLITTGTSSATYGNKIICRNFTDGRQEIQTSVPDGDVVEDVVALPGGESADYSCGDDGSVRFAAEPGSYSVLLKE